MRYIGALVSVRWLRTVTTCRRCALAPCSSRLGSLGNTHHNTPFFGDVKHFLRFPFAHLVTLLQQCAAIVSLTTFDQAFRLRGEAIGNPCPRGVERSTEPCNGVTGKAHLGVPSSECLTRIANLWLDGLRWGRCAHKGLATRGRFW